MTRLGGFFLNDPPSYETEFIKKVLSESKKDLGRDKVFLSDVFITLIAEDQDEQDQQPSAYSPDYVAVLLDFVFPEKIRFVARADREKLRSLALQILQKIDP
ncbi:MAG: hypothetical protein OXN90_10585 [Gemmatimonadota bacterium]|nr:hypothetical protein [Gemmatimonadota bacterium]